MKTETETTGTSTRTPLTGFLRPRDRDLIALVAIARYLSTEQARRLVFASTTDSTTCRKRLHSLAGLPMKERRQDAHQRRAVFDPPYLRRLQFRDSLGHLVDLWALSSHGYAIAHHELGGDRKPTREDVGSAFLGHAVALTDLFVALAAPFTGAGVRACELPFHWDPIDSKHLPWQEYDSDNDKKRARRIIPDAVLELTGTRRRYFIECEMGTHSIVAASDEKAGATLAKTERYDEFFARNFYADSFPDRWPAEVLFLVRTDTRRESVNTALANWSRARAGVAVHARAVTLSQAASELLPLLPPPPARPFPSRPPRARNVTPTEAQTLKRFYQESLRRLDAAQRASPRAVDSDFLALASEVRGVISRLCGASRPTTNGGAP